MADKKKILIVDDEFEMLTSIEKILRIKYDYDISSEQNPAKAIKLVSTNLYDLIISDLKMAEYSGVDILHAAIKKNPESKVIVISGYGTIEASVEAMREGAFDFLEKPFSSTRMYESIDRALETIVNAKIINSAEPKIFEGIIYTSREMENVVDLIQKISKGEMNILISGESGTGKEMVARAIHNLSKGQAEPFVPINCGALPEQLFESELFGHEKGSFTGAIKTKPGLLEFANNGSFFFDEIGEMTEMMQVKLLRMLEEKKIRRVGGQKEIEINVRIIAATNKNLAEEVEKNRFRKDLYYRLSTFQIEIPPLSERKEDIITLINHFMNNISDKEGGQAKILSSEAMEALENYNWPGNVRELQNLINRAYFLCPANTINLSDLPLPVSSHTNLISSNFINLNYKNAREKLLEKFDIEYLSYYLKKNNGNVTKTANDCGIDRRSIHRLINKYKLIYRNV